MLSNSQIQPEEKLYFTIVLFQMEISHKNQVPMLLAPPPKSRSLFSFLSLGLTRSASKDFLEDQ